MHGVIYCTHHGGRGGRAGGRIKERSGNSARFSTLLTQPLTVERSTQRGSRPIKERSTHEVLDPNTATRSGEINSARFSTLTHIQHVKQKQTESKTQKYSHRKADKLKDNKKSNT